MEERGEKVVYVRVGSYAPRLYRALNLWPSAYRPDYPEDPLPYYGGSMQLKEYQQRT